MAKLWGLCLKYKEQLLYLVFGGLTTLLNITAYFVCSRPFGFSPMLSNLIAWVVGVLFAFVTNKLFVFCSRGLGIKKVLREFLAFVTCRLVSLAADMGMMYLLVSFLQLPDMPVKITANIVVILLNYLFSKFLIFKKTAMEVS